MAGISDELLHELKLRAAREGAAPPLSHGELEKAEDRLGFELPAAVTTVYRLVANGGFGPGYGLIGLLAAWSTT